MLLNAFWTGSNLTYLEQLCLTSAIDVGHKVDLWSYERIGNIPAGVQLRDASEVMPKSMCVWNKKKNSPGVGADIFRILLQKQNRGCYIDCDMLFLKQMADAEYIFCEDGNDLVNNAVLKLPPDCPVIDQVLELAASDPIILPWWSRKRRLRQRLKSYIGWEMKIDALPWIALGPRALTYFLEQHNLRHHALPGTVFYPVPSTRAADVLTPGAAVHERITNKTVAVHLWNNQLGQRKYAPPPIGSFVADHMWRLEALDLAIGA
jgi:hypothetical protein